MPSASGAGDEGSKVVERAETRLDGIVTAIRAADGVGDAGVALARAEGVVLPLAKRRADGVDRGEVDDVETHLGDGGEALGRLGEGGAAGGIGPGGAGEHLVPGGEAGRGAIDDDLQLLVVNGLAVTGAGAAHGGRDLRGEEDAHGRRLRCHRRRWRRWPAPGSRGRPHRRGAVPPR